MGGLWDAIWQGVVINSMTNGLLALYDLLFNNFFLALAVFTLITRLVMLPLNVRQQRSTIKMQQMQPQIKEIQSKYKDNPQKMQEEFQKIGYSPTEQLGGCLVLFIQFPIFIGLYRAIQYVLASSPQAMFELSERVWLNVFSLESVTALLPVKNTFLWLNLAQPDPTYILPILVVATMFISQRLLTPTPQTTKNKKPAKDGKKEPEDAAASMQKQMMYTMPLMFGFFSLQFPAGVSIYFIFANLISMLQGWLARRSVAEERAELERSKAAKASESALSTAGAGSSTSQNDVAESRPPSTKKAKRKSKSKNR
ncbi:MAG: YidC/Oxa1 family membrane protein insertase [Anaerolineae bacterium]|nr:YidC/Oxa1 family membrane protein insertase [Anaerolineae bacterium]MCO5188004.1 YidC/Oxa1 family membrane protein insertase [Anaerolineae bacterium]MCO5194626.1 YidC/Oxa1 family membrane protein insertase [Anaerolineae bacterium]MCO5205037.1 YidC/Oxa1 family membrane protein insertase [Anaerolineae bacterium]